MVNQRFQEMGFLMSMTSVYCHVVAQLEYVVILDVYLILKCLHTCF